MAFRLIVTTGEHAGEEVDIDQRGVFVGRGADADLQLRDDDVEFTHAAFRLEGGRVVVEGLAAQRLIIDGDAVDRATITPGAVIGIGSATLELIDTGDASDRDKVRNLIKVLLAVLLLVSVAGGVAIVLLEQEPPQLPPIRASHEAEAFDALHDWLVQSRDEHDPLVVLFEQAWFADIAGEHEKATRLYAEIFLRMGIEPLGEGDATVLEQSSPIPSTQFRRLVGLPESVGADPVPFEPEAAHYSDALVHLVRIRWWICRSRSASQGDTGA